MKPVISKLLILTFTFMCLLQINIPNLNAGQTGGKLEGLFTQEPTLQTLNSKDFITGSRKLYFRWNSSKMETARAPAYRNTPTLSFLGIKVWECLVHFQKGQFKKMEIFLFSRGDVGSVQRDAFMELLNSTKARISKWSDSKGSKVTRKKINRQQHYFQSWKKPPYLINLTYSYSGKRKHFKAEYIKVAIKNKTKSAVALNNTEVKKNKNSSLTSNIKRTKSGDVYIDNIPMVDQGQRGYCAVATAERVIKYYGIDISQHQIAQIANSSSSRGTNRSEMLKALKKAGTKFRIKVKELYDGEDLSSWASFKRFVNKYNTYARKSKAPKFDPQHAVSGRMFSPMKFFEFADYNAFKNYKVKGEKRGLKDFKKDIKKLIDRGIPLVWSIMTGLYNEPGIPQQQIAGHMRLIIGYNFNKDYLIYSDSWGQGHEKKKMKFDDAWTISMGSSYFAPRDRK